jgi:hypothetical protein
MYAILNQTVWLLPGLLRLDHGAAVTGRIFTRDGRLAAGIAQESLFRPGTRRRGPLAE